MTWFRIANIMHCTVNEIKSRLTIEEKHEWEMFLEVWPRGIQCDPDPEAVKKYDFSKDAKVAKTPEQFDAVRQNLLSRMRR